MRGFASKSTWRISRCLVVALVQQFTTWRRGGRPGGPSLPLRGGRPGGPSLPAMSASVRRCQPDWIRLGKVATLTATSWNRLIESLHQFKTLADGGLCRAA
jgi:hypothetical protein